MFKKLTRFLYNIKANLDGNWETSDEGGLQMLGGNRLLLQKEGTGTLFSWGWGENEPYNYEEDIVWRRIGFYTIAIKRVTEKEFNIVQFKIEEYQGPYGQIFLKMYEPRFKLGDTEIKGFWNIPGELYKKVK